MKSRLWVMVAGLLVMLVAAQSLALFGGKSPSIVSPVPLLLFVPVSLGVSGIAVALAYGLVFFAWQPSNTKHAIFPRMSSAWPGLSVCFLSAFYYFASWQSAVLYQGMLHVVICLSINVTLALACATATRHVRTRPSFLAGLVTHTLLFIWLASYAFPYLGETP